MPPRETTAKFDMDSAAKVAAVAGVLIVQWLAFDMRSKTMTIRLEERLKIVQTQVEEIRTEMRLRRGSQYLAEDAARDFSIRDTDRARLEQRLVHLEQRVDRYHPAP